MAGKDKSQPVEVVARTLGISPRRVQQLCSEGVLPKVRRGRYDLLACVHAYIKYWQDKAEGRAATSGDSDVLVRLREEKVALAAADARLRELDLEKRRETMMLVQDSTDLLATAAGRIRATMQTWPARWSADLVKRTRKDAREILKRMVAEGLRALSEIDPTEGNGKRPPRS